MNKQTNVSSVMTTHLFLLNETDSISKASKMFLEHNIRHLPVVSNNKIAGIISQTDIERLSFGSEFLSKTSYSETTFLDALKVEDIMKSNPDCVNEEDDIIDTARKLADKNFHAFPVVDHSGHLTGIITTTDVIKYLIDNQK